MYSRSHFNMYHSHFEVCIADFCPHSSSFQQNRDERMPRINIRMKIVTFIKCNVLASLTVKAVGERVLFVHVEQRSRFLGYGGMIPTPDRNRRWLILLYSYFCCQTCPSRWLVEENCRIPPPQLLELQSDRGRWRSSSQDAIINVGPCNALCNHMILNMTRISLLWSSKDPFSETVARAILVPLQIPQCFISVKRMTLYVSNVHIKY